MQTLRHEVTYNFAFVQGEKFEFGVRQMETEYFAGLISYFDEMIFAMWTALEWPGI